MNTSAKRIILLFIFFQMLFSQAQTTNGFDNNGKKHGIWKGFYEESKRLRYEGTFEHGKEVGTFNFFDDTKERKIIATRTFDYKDNSVYTILFDAKDNIISEGKSIDKLNEGLWKLYHPGTKVLMLSEYYKSGRLNGLRSVYYPDGAPTEECFYKNGVKDGAYKKYTQSGVVLESSFYKNGVYDGEAIFRDGNGNLAGKGFFKDGKKVGVWEIFKDGKITDYENYDKPKPQPKQNKKTVLNPKVISNPKKLDFDE